MVHQVIHPRLHAFGSAEIHPIQLAHRLDLFPRARQADDRGVKLSEVVFENGRGVARWVAGDEDGE